MSKKTLIAATVGTAFAAALAAPAVLAAENPFALSSLGNGYMVTAQNAATPAVTPAAATKAAEGKCGGSMMKGKTMDGMCGMSMADTNKDGKISKDEADKMHAAMFAQMDANKDGFIDQDEMNKMKGSMCGGMKGKGMEGKCGGMNMK